MSFLPPVDKINAELTEIHINRLLAIYEQWKQLRELEYGPKCKPHNRGQGNKWKSCVGCAVPIWNTALRCHSCATKFRYATDGGESKRKISEGLRAAHIRGDFAKRRYPHNGPSNLEKEAWATLDSWEVEYEPQYKPPSYGSVYDLYLPQSNLLIEIDGEYWHHSDMAYAKEQPKRDKAKNGWAREHGYKLVRIRERDIKVHGIKTCLKAALDLAESATDSVSDEGWMERVY